MCLTRINLNTIKNVFSAAPEMVTKADLRFADVSERLGSDWINLANELDVPQTDLQRIESNYDTNREKALAMLKLWSSRVGPSKATGNTLERALRAINREDIINSSIRNVQRATDSIENAINKVGADQSGFELLKEELGPSRNTSRGTSLGREASIDVSYDEQDIMKVTLNKLEYHFN